MANPDAAGEPASRAAPSGRLLNVGCGARFHPAWVNVDAVPAAPEVRAIDVRAGLPFGDGEFAVVYSSHVLEHLGADEAAGLLKQMHRVLAPGGIVRIVVPDLEAIAREYLRILGELRGGNRAAEAQYDWIMLELLDQVARDRSGGEMAKHLACAEPARRGYILSRIGAEAQRAWDAGQRPLRARLWERIRQRGPGWLFHQIRSRAAGVLIGLVGGSAARSAYLTGLFRQSGEVHRWMYDSYSLGRLLAGAGFVDVRVCAAAESGIAGFAAYHLDVDERGSICKPDSLFMEARRPAA